MEICLNLETTTGSLEKFKEGLPSKDKFYNTFTNREISGKNYEHVLNVWKAIKINTLIR